MKLQKPSKAELSEQALAWAEFLYDEYVLEKHKQLLLEGQQPNIEVDKEG